MYFVNDLMVLCKGYTESLQVVKKSLDEFSNVSGLFPNLSKSTIFFGSICEKDKGDMLQIIPFKCRKLLMKYLGLLLLAKRIGNGKSISVWHDKWCDQGTLDRKDKGKAPAVTPILMVSQEAHIAKSLAQENTDYGGKEIIFHPVARVNNAPVIIEAKIFGRKSIGEVPFEITIGDAPLSRTKTLNFIIVRSDSPHNMLLGRIAMQRMGIVVSTIHGAIKFHTEKGIGTVVLTDEANERTKRAKKIPSTSKERVLSCVNAEEKFIVNDKYPDQTVTIGKQLPDHFKKELQNLLKSNADIFVWIHADMIGIPRTLMVEGKPFNTEHKPNEYSHIKPIK
ncbi:hypothetical protein Tco_0046086 [Tanacetum coccineum]